MAIPHRITTMADVLLAERRADTRRRVFKGGLIALNGGGGIDCTVRNLSGGGAELDVAEAARIPPTFQLAIRADNLIARCRVIWNKGRRVGIAFD